MSDMISDTIVIFATESYEKSHKFLNNLPKDKIISLFIELLKTYMNDKNSSTLRERITLYVSGYEHLNRKIGFDGFKKEGRKTIYCEVKPQNIDTENNKIIKTPRKHNGGGNFTDYTFARFDKDKKEKPNMLISGFVDGALVFVLEFPFNCKGFTDKLEMQLKRRFPKGDKSGEFLRSAIFYFKDYEKCKKLKLIYINKIELKKNRTNLSSGFYELLSTLKIS